MVPPPTRLLLGAAKSRALNVWEMTFSFLQHVGAQSRMVSCVMPSSSNSHMSQIVYYGRCSNNSSRSIHLLPLLEGAGASGSTVVVAFFLPNSALTRSACLRLEAAGRTAGRCRPNEVEALMVARHNG